MMTTRSIAVVAVIAVATALSVRAQESFSTGQNIAPAYEGWEKNADGSFNLVFGYFNRNWQEEIDVPVATETPAGEVPATAQAVPDAAAAGEDKDGKDKEAKKGGDKKG